MKKVLLILFMGACSLFVFAGDAFAGASIDQQHTDGGAATLISGSLGRFAQTFKPTYTRLDKVEIELSNVGANKTMSVSIRHRTGSFWDEGNVATISNQAIGNGWNTFDFPDITVGITDNDSYGIYIDCPDGTTMWKYKSGPSVYSRGYAIWQNQDKYDWDWNFKTWGYDPTEIIEEQDISEQQNSDPEQTVVTPAGQTAGTGDAPATATSTAVKAPADLKAEYSNSAVKLTWTKSTTTDIDGYKIFRSEEKLKGFKEIGKTTKAKLEYLDNSSLTADKTYYYMVRAYKVKEESASTATVEIKIPVAETTATSETVKKTSAPISFDTYSENFNALEVQLYWILGGVIGVLLVLLMAYERERTRKEGGFLKGSHFKLTR